MKGYLSLLLHAHLPFVRHPEHAKFLEENWFFEAVTETYVPLLWALESWVKDGMRAPVTLTLSPTLCSMLLDPLLQSRYRAHLEGVIDLAEKETHRTLWEKPLHELAVFYFERFRDVRAYFDHCEGNLVARFRKLQDDGYIEIATCAATHALLPLLADHVPSIRAQVLVARDHYRECFGRDPEGIWLPECAYVPGVEPVLCEAGLRWFATETHGIMQARPEPRYGIFAPIVTPSGLAVFGRDLASAKQVWSRNEGYPGDASYRDFYRDIGFDLDFDYLRPYLPGKDQRGFTGIKYYRITGPSGGKAVYDLNTARARADQHAEHFLKARIDQIGRLTAIMDHPPIVFCPYDAELFGHWWYEGIDFLNFFVRKAYHDQKTFDLISPGQFLRQYPTHQVASPAPSSWGEDGYWRVWLNETTEWIYPHLRVAQERMSELARAREANPLQRSAGTSSESCVDRALKQAARELLLAQASDWPFILRTGTSPGYARKRVTDHLLRFTRLYEEIQQEKIDENALKRLEEQDNLFPQIDCRYFR